MNNLSRRKRIVYIIIGLIALGVIGFLLYRLLVAPAAKPPEELPRIVGRPIVPPPGAPPGAEQAPGVQPLPELPSIAEQRLVRLTDFAVISPALNKDQSRVLYYKKDGGDLYLSDFSGKTQDKISNLTIIGLIEAIWNRTGERAAVRYLDGDTVKSFLHIGTSSVAVLPQDITSVAWSPDGKSLAYLLPREGRIDLVVADAGAKNPRTIFQTPLLDSSLAWASADLLMLGTAPSGAADGFLFAFSRGTGSFTKILGPQPGLAVLWSPGANTALISLVERGREPALSLYDRIKKESRTIEVATLSEKCAWAGDDSIFCAAPREIPAQILLPDDYLRGEFNSSDRIVEIELKTGAVTPIFDEGNFDIADLLVTRDKKYLLFVNRMDGTLWSLKLK